MKPLPAGLVDELREIATGQQRPLAELVAEAQDALTELASRRSGAGSWGFATLSRFVRRLGYPQKPIHDQAELSQTRQAMQAGSLVFLVTHKTYLDFFVLFEFFYANGLLPPRIFGGANMAFAGFGPLARRSGGIFIRRSFKDDPVYKATLRHYISDLLVQKESFMWAIEGTRSRTGKLLIPKLGLLNYVTTAARPLGEDAVSFVPVAVVYDRIPDVADMAAQEAGARKQKESLSWFFAYLRKLRGDFGDIHIRFGAPITLGETPKAPDLVPASDQPGLDIAVQKLAFEVCFRINEITPATMNSLVLLSMLCRGPCSKEQLQVDARDLQLGIVELHPEAGERKPSRPAADDPAASIDALLEAGLLEHSEPDSSAELRIRPAALSEAIYYSNMAAHHFVIVAFTELALALMAAESADFNQARFDEECLRLRELFKFEFFFSPKAVFHQQLLSELARLQITGTGADGPDRKSPLQILRNKSIRVAIGVLVPYIGAYRAVVERLLADPLNAGLDDAALIRLCLELDRHRPIDTRNMVRPGLSRALLSNGLRVLESRRIRNLEADPGLHQRRQQFLDELGQIEQALELLAALNSGAD